MESKVTVNDAELFAAYAGDDIEVWRKIVGRQVTHTKFGSGTVTEVYEGTTGTHGVQPIRIRVRFRGLRTPEDEKLFLTESFEKHFTDLALPEYMEGIEPIREQLQRQNVVEERRRKEAERRAQRLKRQQEKEAEAARHFTELKAQYLVSDYRDRSPSSPLYAILLRLEEGEMLSKTDVDWLEDERLFEVIAKFYEDNIPRDNWNVVRAGKYWRRAKQPQKALELTEEARSDDAILMSAIFTNRGGAFRDLRELQSAKVCAKEALRYNPHSHYACNLLGAIAYQSGEPEDGDRYFKKAEELGAVSRDQDEEIRTALDNADAESQQRAARYLLNKDPERFDWAKYYLTKHN